MLARIKNLTFILSTCCFLASVLFAPIALAQESERVTDSSQQPTTDSNVEPTDDGHAGDSKETAEHEAKSSPWFDVFNVAVAIFLVALNGFFVAGEFALVKVRGSQIEELVRQGKPFSKTAHWLAERLEIRSVFSFTIQKDHNEATVSIVIIKNANNQ